MKEEKEENKESGTVTVVPMDWNARIAAAEKRGAFTADDKVMGSNYRTCKTADILPIKKDFTAHAKITSRKIYDKYGAIVEDLSWKFYRAVDTDNVTFAREMAAEIDGAYIYVRIHQTKVPPSKAELDALIDRFMTHVKKRSSNCISSKNNGGRE